VIPHYEPETDEDPRQPCPECNTGRVVVTSYDDVNNAWDAHCSNHCGWTS
jgi:transcription elongation factor Elf1